MDRKMKEMLTNVLTVEEYENLEARRIAIKDEETGEADAWEYDFMVSKGIW